MGRCLSRDQVLIVSTPELKKRFSRAGQKAVRRVPVIARALTSSSNTWPIAGPLAKEIAVQTVLELPLFTMIRDAALTGLGAARWPNLVVADDLAAGRLVSWGPATVQSAELWVLHTSRRVRFLQNCDAIWFKNFNQISRLGAGI